MKAIIAAIIILIVPTFSFASESCEEKYPIDYTEQKYCKEVKVFENIFNNEFSKLIDENAGNYKFNINDFSVKSKIYIHCINEYSSGNYFFSIDMLQATCIDSQLYSAKKLGKI